MKTICSGNTSKNANNVKVIFPYPPLIIRQDKDSLYLQDKPSDFKKTNYLLMRKIIFISLFFVAIINFNLSAQETTNPEKYGKTLNLGLGIGGYAGYYGYVGHSLPIFHINYEFEVAKNFTLAPFVSFGTYSNKYYWGDSHKNYPYRYYSYRETIIPIGVKGTYYFDQLLKANAKWDFYLAGSLGYSIVNSSWDSDYYGDRNYYHNGNTLFLDIHIGAEYHVNNRIGLFLDLSSGVSTVGIAIH